MLSTMRASMARLVWETEWRWGPWSLLMGPWGWTAGWFVKNRMRCWTWRSRWAPSCSPPSRCHWGSSWINTGLANYDCWAGERMREESSCEVVYVQSCEPLRCLRNFSFLYKATWNLQLKIVIVIYLQHVFWILLSTNCLWILQSKWWDFWPFFITVFERMCRLVKKKVNICDLCRTLRPYLHCPDFQWIWGHVHDLHLSHGEFFFFCTLTWSSHAAEPLHSMVFIDVYHRCIFF